MDERHEMAVRLINIKLLEVDKEIKMNESEISAAQRKIDTLTEVQKSLEFSKQKLIEERG